MSTVAENAMPMNIVERESRWNFGSGSLWTHHGWQYAAYWDKHRQVSVARRKLPQGEWSTVSLPGYQRTDSGDRGKGGAISRGFGDGHEKVVMGISPDGVIHLSFDHHLSTLRYQTTIDGVANEPEQHEWSADLFGPVRNNLGGETITSVTYPSFTSDGTHFTLYLRLNGGAGSADSHFFYYRDGTWTTSNPADGKLIDKRWQGGNKTVNAYPHGLVKKDGRRHLTWSWRDTPNPKSSHDLCYAYSDDQGETWLNGDGQLIGRSGSEFITADSPGVAAWKIPTGTSYFNGGSMTVDNDGRVHLVVRGEKRSATYYSRDPETKKWTRQRSPVLGKVITGTNNKLFLVSDNGVWTAPADDFGKVKKLYSGKSRYFDDSKPVLDNHRLAHDGWISVIGQVGTTVTVIDYKVE